MVKRVLLDSGSRTVCAVSRNVLRSGPCGVLSPYRCGAFIRERGVAVSSVINAFVLAFVEVTAYLAVLILAMLAFCFIVTLYVFATIAFIVRSAFAGLCNDN
jgi:hypothetical protein